MSDMLKLLRQSSRTARPVVFDVGGNIGYFTRQFHDTLGNPLIHVFEPGPESFLQLQKNCAEILDITLNNLGLGAEKKELVFEENEQSVMSSFLEPGPDHWDSVSRKVKVPVRTVDDYCKEKNIERIGILKSDTQGYDLQVFRGAERMIEEGRIDLIFTEIILARIYSGSPNSTRSIAIFTIETSDSSYSTDSSTKAII